MEHFLPGFRAKMGPGRERRHTLGKDGRPSWERQRDFSHPLAWTTGDTLMGLQVALWGLIVRQPRSEWQLLCLIEKRLWARPLIPLPLSFPFPATGINGPTSTIVRKVNRAGTWREVTQVTLFTSSLKEKNVKCISPAPKPPAKSIQEQIPFAL